MKLVVFLSLYCLLDYLERSLDEWAICILYSAPSNFRFPSFNILCTRIFMSNCRWVATKKSLLVYLHQFILAFVQIFSTTSFNIIRIHNWKLYNLNQNLKKGYWQCLKYFCNFTLHCACEIQKIIWF